MKIKICGLKDPGNIKAVAGLKPDFIGFIRYSKSPRFSEELPADVLKQLPAGMIKTAVFVDEEMPVIDALIEKYKLDAVQLHGGESPEFCAKLKSKVKVLKAFGLDEHFDFKILENFRSSSNSFRHPMGETL